MRCLWRDIKVFCRVRVPRKPYWQNISNRMELKLHDRRCYMNGSPAIVDIRKEYPTLFNFDQVCIWDQVQHKLQHWMTWAQNFLQQGQSIFVTCCQRIYHDYVLVSTELINCTCWKKIVNALCNQYWLDLFSSPFNPDWTCQLIQYTRV